MLMPQELKKHEFDYALRGYSTAEVDEYIQFICEKYEELYRENTELERKLVAALRLVDEVSHRDPTAEPSSPNVSLQAGRMLQEAERQKKRIVADAEEYADRIIADADAHVAKQAQVLEEMKQAVLAFRDDLYARYSRQIDQIEELAASVQDNRITVPAPMREVSIPAVQKQSPLPEEPQPETEAEKEAEPIAEEEPEMEMPQEFSAEESEEEESLLVFPLESGEPLQDDDDGVDEEELAATDEALAFFEEFGDDSAQEEEPAEDGDIFVYEEESEPDGEDAEEMAEAEEEETEDAELPPETEPTETDEFDEYGDEVIPGGEPIGDDEDPLAGFDERIAALLGMDTMSSPEETDEAPAEDEFSEDFLQIIEEEAEGTEDGDRPAEESDDDLLRELRQAFHFQLEEFEKEDEAERAESEEKKEFSFLPESEETEEEPLHLFDRLTGRTHDTKKKDK